MITEYKSINLDEHINALNGALFKIRSHDMYIEESNELIVELEKAVTAMRTRYNEAKAEGANTKIQFNKEFDDFNTVRQKIFQLVAVVEGKRV